MRHFLSTVAVVALLAIPALADPLQDGLQNQAQGQLQGQQQGQVQGQAQGQGQAQFSSNKNFNANQNSAYSGSAAGAAAFNKGNVFKNQTNVDASTDVEAEPAIAPNVTLTSANCIGSASAAGAGGGVVSLGFGVTISYDDCFKIEVAKTYIAMGLTDKATAVLESIEFVNEAVNPEPETVALPGADGRYSELPNGEVIAWKTPRIQPVE